MAAYFRATWDLTPQATLHIEAVHRLSNLGAVITLAAQGTSQQGFDAEWRIIELLTLEGDRLHRVELFDEADLDTALARFDELKPPAPRLENAASQVYERCNMYFAARDWDAMAENLADDIAPDDRRRVVGSGVQRGGRKTVIANTRAIADLGMTNVASTVVATRGQHLILTRARYSGSDQGPGAFQSDMLDVVEINAGNRMVASVVFDLDDIDAAFEELDARYLAGEAAASANAWSVIAGSYAAFNRREMFPTTPDWVNLDHRRGTPFVSAGDTTAAIRAFWDLTPDFRMHVEAVHRLSDFGAVVTHTSYGTSKEGFDAEWRMIQLLTVDGDRVDRFELFDEADLDAALARFDELSRPAPRLQNAASQAYERFWTYFAARDWAAFAELLATDIFSDDRRRVVNGGARHGRDAEIIDKRVLADLGVTDVTSTVIATRGERLALSRVGASEFQTEVLNIAEIDADDRIVAIVGFDLDDVDAAFEELDARYLAGEAASHAHTWSVVAEVYAALNRRELPATTPDWVNIDHQQVTTVAPGDFIANIRASWDVAPTLKIYIEAVHRLSDLGAVVTHTGHGTSQAGFDAEWRTISLYTVDRDLINRCELFDETDLDAALARFDELSRPAPDLENAATRIWARIADAFNRRDLDGCLSLTTAEGRLEDRRKGLRALHDGPARRKAVRALFEASPSSWRMELEPIAIRGSRLSLTRVTYRDTDDANRPIAVELLTVMEVSDGDLVHDSVDFDPDDIDAAFEELDARYLGGEAAADAQAWSVIARTYATLNRHEIPPTTPNWVNIDHRRGTPFASGNFTTATMRATSIWEIAPDLRINIETVHRLSSLGVVVTIAAHGTSPEGFAAEWHAIELLTVEGDLVSRCELFDEADIDAALARFDELSPSSSLENAATRTWARLADAFNRRDLDDFVALTRPDGHFEDRRKGLRDSHDGSMRRRVAQTLFDLPSSWRLDIEHVAITGSRLCLIRQIIRDSDDADRPITIELLTVLEVSQDGLAHTIVLFDPDDFSGAMAELTARWIASGEVAHPEVIERERRLVEAANRHDWDAFAEISAGATYVNHRQLSADGVHTIAAHMSSIQTMASLVPDMRMELAEVLGHSTSVVLTQLIVKGTSTDGVVMELPLFVIDVHDGEHVTHMETFDIDQRDLALARFQELNG